MARYACCVARPQIAPAHQLCGIGIAMSITKRDIYVSAWTRSASTQNDG